MISNSINVVIGSWGSYNECNNRALGSKWLDLSDYESWEEIEEELKNEGFILNGIDEELFIQDIEGIDDKYVRWDYMHPKRLFEILKTSEILDNSYKYDTFSAYMEVRSFEDFETLVNGYGSDWDRNINVWKNYSWSDYGRQMFEDCYCGQYKNIEDILDNYFDFEAYGESMKYDGIEEYSDGLIEIR